MKTYEKLPYDLLDGRIETYVNSAIAALQNFFQCDAALVDGGIVEKENFIDNSRIVFLMNIKRMKGEEVDQQYAFFYISLEKEQFYEFSKLVCEKNNMPVDNPNLRVSAVKECCNRIGARLLKFIEDEVYSFDIGTPILLPTSSRILKDVPIDPKKIIQLWPFNYYKQTININHIPVHFACTLLETPKQRYEILTSKVVNMAPDGSETVIEKEVKYSECPNVFDLHYLINLVTDEQLVVSLSKKYLSDTMGLFEIANKSDDTRKDSILSYIKENINVREIEIYENSYPPVPEDCPTKIARISRGRAKIHMAITAII